MSASINKHTHNYTPDKLADSPYSGLIYLRNRAIENGSEDLVSMCEFEMSKRPPLPKAPFKRVSAYSNTISGRSPSVTETDNQTSVLLAELMLELSKSYDLSKETAQKLSEGSPNFKAHNLLSADGGAKVGGARIKGRVAISNFVSYRLKKDVFALCIVLEHNKPPSSTKYIVLAPKEYLKTYIEIEKLIPMEEDDDFGLVHGGEEFKNFDDALDTFTKIIDKVAPKKSN